MVIIFESEKARSFLLKNGYVYTFRLKKHRTGRDWMNDGYGKPKIADVDIVELGRVVNFLDDDLKHFLKPFVFGSGFSSARGWLDEIKILNKPKKIRDWSGWLYRVDIDRPLS